MDFRLKSGDQFRTVMAVKASATVIEPGDFVESSAGLMVKATATGAKIAWCKDGAPAGTTNIAISEGNNFLLEGTTDANFAAANRSTDVDLVVTDGVQLIDIGETTTKVLTVGVGPDAGTVGAKTNVEVKINKPII